MIRANCKTPDPRKNARCLIFLFACLLATTGCGQKNKQQDIKQILRLNLTADPISLDPRVVRSLKDLTLVKQLFEGLMRLDEAGKPQAAVAESVEISEDCLTYTFHLRDTFWTNSDPVTAYDFEYAWRSVLNPDFASDYAYMLYPINNAQAVKEGKSKLEALGVNALDNRTLCVQLKAPTPYFLELVAFPAYYPVNRTIDGEQKNWPLPSGKNFVCNGPFHLKNWKPESDLIVEKNPFYWDHQAVHLDQIAFTVIGDTNTESQLYEKNDLDWLGPPISNSIDRDMISKMKAEGELHSYSVAGTYWLNFNTEKEPFNHTKVRKAFSYALNRKEIIDHILQGNQPIATGLLPPCMRQSQELYFEDGAVQKAKSLLDEAFLEMGWSKENFPKIVLSYSGKEKTSKIVQMVQQQWQNAFGISVELLSMENKFYLSALNQGKFQVAVRDWFADFNDPLSFLEIFKYKKDGSNGTGMNDTGWYNERFTALLEHSLVEYDLNKRNVLLRDAEKILIDEMPIAPIYHYAFDYLTKPHVKNVVLSPLGSIDFKSAELK